MPHECEVFEANGAKTHVVVAGGGKTTVVVVPGTNFNAATVLPLATALARRHRTVLADVPGQPGLSSGERGLAQGRLAWYGPWLSEVVGACVSGSGPVVVLGHSFGAAIALSSAKMGPGDTCVMRSGSNMVRYTYEEKADDWDNAYPAVATAVGATVLVGSVGLGAWLALQDDTARPPRRREPGTEGTADPSDAGGAPS
ncbi:alpha/beta fold hydrolase [Streptomyces sp. NPDC085481]|uniref:alpha/beta fold hydrolase n=1 Tax=Streptomyces sp. NPDC085481 TaxID=3365727 RepID=UPI0037D26FEE